MRPSREFFRIFALFFAVVLVFFSFSPNIPAEDYSIIDNLFFKDFQMIGSAVSDDWVKSATIAGSIAGITAIVMYNDESIRNEVRKRSGSTGDVFFDVVNEFGNPVYVIAADSLLLLGGKKEVKTGQKIIEAIAITGLINYAGKVVFGRERPGLGSGSYSYNWFDFSDNSMPSGHTGVAFACAAVLGDNYDIGYITYPVAALVGIARIYKNAHWPSDVIVAAAVGIIIGKAINFDNGIISISASPNGFLASYKF